MRNPTRTRLLAVAATVATLLPGQVFAQTVSKWGMPEQTVGKWDRTRQAVSTWQATATLWPSEHAQSYAVEIGTECAWAPLVDRSLACAGVVAAAIGAPSPLTYGLAIATCGWLVGSAIVTVMNCTAAGEVDRGGVGEAAPNALYRDWAMTNRPFALSYEAYLSRSDLGASLFSRQEYDEIANFFRLTNQRIFRMRVGHEHIRD